MTDRITNDPWAGRRRLGRARNWWVVLFLPVVTLSFAGLTLITASEPVISTATFTVFVVWNFFHLRALVRYARWPCPRCGSAFGQGTPIPFVRGRCRSCGLREGDGFTLVKYDATKRSQGGAV